MDIVGNLNSAFREIPAWTIYVVGAVWASWLFYLGLTGGLGAEPINALEREYGEVALKLMVVGLVVTPLRKYTGVNLLKFRRAIGVTAFFFVLAHFSVWAVLDIGSLGRVWVDILKRPYVTIGMASFLMLIPLAITSNNTMVKRLGAASWRQLHKLTYPAALLGAIHYIWLVKGFQIEPLVYLAIILGLLAVRFKASQRLRTA
ncbi:protein-methionine-sulfoxide reductase heme-binding subunit MsrQ [Thalassobium sp. R2A62]|jgi:methionine sulfoxide reductase heme-binding subunit|uniref:protein-methionine-sulfoxide reductase heme-binding subunit MsrQ n=1 Tax=Thalassobium sp. R2A62 TaxID=633131 RepID=UPI0001B1D201|nr:protein-methionine-sulfoxide reductase heme-binding subunit MsrQ [Thalassobium sp. R2A62]EET48140.1 ferric reductase domain protein transmembrane component domain [Thalassobium sp. R2A62]MDG1339217.1 protein-methionine-sulfoxide reductase heme-binding subunit MsrQ [Paracoccaceae bacterium]MDG2451590.1 protein-methionine-sulfoxide reductase heme-binding subunit MsrQ [Paracoccaceae bacterium]